MNKAADGVLLVVPFGEGVGGVFFEVVVIDVEAGDPFGVLLPGVVGDLGIAGPLFAVEGIAGDGNGAVKVADGVFDGQAAVCIELVVEAEFGGKSLAFVAFEIAVGAVSVAFEILHVAAYAIFKAGVEAQAEFCFFAEIDE